jgi:hypothetical protein
VVVPSFASLHDISESAVSNIKRKLSVFLTFC